ASLSFCINMFAPCNCSNCCQLLAVDLAAPLPPPSLAFGHWPRNTFAFPFRLASLVPRFHSDWFNRSRFGIAFLNPLQLVRIKTDLSKFLKANAKCPLAPFETTLNESIH